MKRKLIALCAPLALVSTSAFAQVYAGIELGYGNNDNTSQNVANGLVNAVGGVVSVTQDTTYSTGRIFGGYNFTENIGVELGYTQSSNINTNAVGVAGNSVAYTASEAVSVNGYDYSVLLRPSKSTGFNGLFLRLGATNLTESGTWTATGTSTVSGSSSISGSGTVVGFGYDQEITDKWSIRYSYTDLTKIANTSDNAIIYSAAAIVKF